MRVGKEDYPFIPDFVEETRRFGVSKKIKRDFDPSKLTRNESQLVLIHNRGIPLFKYLLEFYVCHKPYNFDVKKIHEGQCIWDLWELSTSKSFKKKHEVEINEKSSIATIKTPSVKYQCKIPIGVASWSKQKYVPALFLRFPSIRFEYVSKKGRRPKKIEERLKKAGFDMELKEE